MTATDYDVNDHGSIIIFTPLSDSAVSHADTMFADAMQWGGGYAVEHRYAEDILYDLVKNEGFAVDLNGRRIADMVAK